MGLTKEILEKVVYNENGELEFHFKTRNKTEIIKTDGDTVVRLCEQTKDIIY